MEDSTFWKFTPYINRCAVAYDHDRGVERDMIWSFSFNLAEGENPFIPQNPTWVPQKEDQGSPQGRPGAMRHEIGLENQQGNLAIPEEFGQQYYLLYTVPVPYNMRGLLPPQYNPNNPPGENEAEDYTQFADLVTRPDGGILEGLNAPYGGYNVTNYPNPPTEFPPVGNVAYPQIEVGAIMYIPVQYYPNIVSLMSKIGSTLANPTLFDGNNFSIIKTSAPYGMFVYAVVTNFVVESEINPAVPPERAGLTLQQHYRTSVDFNHSFFC
jgi:hypothetical protein